MTNSTQHLVMPMTIEEIARITHSRILCGEDVHPRITRAFASDLMSDVLTLETDHTLLITGLANVQAVRTAEMSDISCILFARNKRVTDDMVRLGRENEMVIMQTSYSVFHTSGLLYEAGIKPIF